MEGDTKKRMSRRRFLRLGCGALLGGMAGCGLSPLYAIRVEPRWIEVARLELTLRGLPAALDGLTIAQISDLHCGPHIPPSYIRHAVALANGLKADLVLLTGDFVTRSAHYSAACAQALADLRPPYGVYAVLGNHDNWTDPDIVAANLERVGITVLRDARHPLEVGGSRLWLLGVEDTGYTGWRGSPFHRFRERWQPAADRLAALLTDIPQEEPRLLLVHNPDFTEMLPPGRVDLALCGHTHGGQVRLPLIGAPIVPSCFGQKYRSGLVQGPRTLVYVNRGIGLVSPPIRLNCRPEVTLLRLRRRAAQG